MKLIDLRVVLWIVMGSGAACSSAAVESSTDLDPGRSTSSGGSSTSSGANTDDTGDTGGSSSSGAPTSSASSGASASSSGDGSDTSSADTGDSGQPVDCRGVTIVGPIRQTAAQVRTNAYLDNVDVTRYAGIWEAHNAQTGENRSTRWGAPAGFALGVYSGQYVALEFATDADQAQLGLLFRELDAALPSAWSYWSISRCPGDFPVAVDGCHWGGGAVGSIGWEIGTNMAPNDCRLEPNTTYYLNILFGTPADPAVPSCPKDSCGHVYQQTVAAN